MVINTNNFAKKIFLGFLLANTTLCLVAETQEIVQVEQQAQVQASEIDELNTMLDSSNPLPQSNPSNPAHYTPAWVKSAVLRVLNGCIAAKAKMTSVLKNFKLYVIKK